MTKKPDFLKNYSFSLLLFASIFIGVLLGIILKKNTVHLKPFGDVFLNLLFTTVVPLVFFSISSSVAGMSDLEKLGKILMWMVLIFVATSFISSVLMVFVVSFFPPSLKSLPELGHLLSNVPQAKPSWQIAQIFTVSDFSHLLSRGNILALIVFAALVGLSASSAGDKGKTFTNFLVSANEVMMKVISYIMLYAPIGLAAYFAYLVGTLGPGLLGSYVRVITVYYPVSMLYFFAGFSCYAFLAAGKNGVKKFWSHIITPSLTAFGTGSSIATIPSNLQAADEIGVPKDISKIVIPIGATIHMDGSCLAAILKISLLFSFFGMNFAGFETIVTAIGIAILTGVVMSGIPGGGFIGELLIVTLYGFPPEALPIISVVGSLVDPPATMVNAVGDNVVSMLIARILGGKNWIKPKQNLLNQALKR